MPELSSAGLAHGPAQGLADLRAVAKSQLAVIDLPEAQAAAMIAAELDGPNAERPIVWTDAESELLVFPHATRVRFAPGFVLIELMVAAEETGRAKLVFPFKVGASPNEAVLMAITEGQPRGDARLAARWGEPATTIVWHAVLRAGLALLARRRLKQPRTIGGVYTLGRVLSFVATQPLDVDDLRAYYKALGGDPTPPDLSVLNRRYLSSLPLSRAAKPR